MSGDRSHLLTEQSNPRTADIDTLPSRAILERIHAEDARAFEAVGESLDAIALAVDHVVRAFRNRGRLIYVGAGTSGRLGMLDAVEIPPTFGTEPDLVQAVIAGGIEALLEAREGAEDVAADGAAAIAALEVDERDVVAGIAAGSTTPFVIGALEAARVREAATLFVTCVTPSDVPFASEIDVLVSLPTGPEVVTGSTRMKAGTATKLVLNMITTTAMIRMGKTYGNRMVDLRVTSEKLADRGRRILRDLLGISSEEATALLERANGRVKTALVMHRRQVDHDEAERLLDGAGGFLRDAWRE